MKENKKKTFIQRDTMQIHSLQMVSENFVAVSLVGLLGPLTWVFHFAIVYLTQQFLCLNASDTASASVTKVIGVATGGACVILGLLIWRSPYLLSHVLDFDFTKQESSMNREDRIEINEASTFQFLILIMRWLAGLSFLAIIWSSSAAVVLNECGGPYL
ncbi:hypothetical protein TDB9533_00456 [Thalassocella blandensis]|nr:hypothetical protein TDB9533_00456 [Thalassocella blandensis]